MESSTNIEELKPVRVEPGSTVRRSGLLFAVGGAAWLLYCGLLLWGLTLVVPTFDPATPSLSIIGAMHLLRPAILVASVATWALALGVLVMRKATVGVVQRNRTQSRTIVYGVSRDARAKGAVSAGILTLFGVLGVPAFAVLAVPTTESITTALSLWLVAAAILFVGAEILSVFTRAVARDTSGHLEVNGSWVSEYAIATLLGLIFLPIAQLLHAPSASAYAGTLYNGMLTAALYAQLLVVPITGIIIWGRFVIVSARLGASRAITTPRPTVVSTGPEILDTGPATRIPPAIRTKDSPPMGSAVENPIPGVVAGMDGGSAGASNPDAKAGLEGSWVLRLQSQVAELEDAMRLQRDALMHLERRIEGVRGDGTTVPPTDLSEPLARPENELEGPSRGPLPRRKPD